MLMCTGALAYDIPQVKTFEIEQSANGGRFKLFVFQPAVPVPEGGFPVIYALDGNSVFLSLVDEVRRKTFLKYGQPAIVVAIGYPLDKPWVGQREQDLVFWPLNYQSEGADSDTTTENASGAAALLSMIDNQVIPTVEKRYPVNPKKRTLFGHSLGGLFTLQVMFKQTGLFQNYVAASPSIWWANEQLFREFEKYAKHYAKEPDSVNLLLTVGECEQTEGECDPHRMRTSEYNQWLVNTGKMVTNVKTMHTKLQELKPNQVGLRIFEGENHASVIAPSLAWAASLAMTSDIVIPPNSEE